MRKICILILLLFVGMFFIAESNEIEASSLTANIEGFNINGLTYNADKKVNHVDIKTSDNWYGSIGLWSAVYTYYAQETDTMLFAIPIVTEIQSSTVSDAIKRFVNRGILLKVDFTNPSATLEVGYPNNSDYNGEYTIDLAAQISTDMSGSIGFTVSSNFKELSLIQTKANRTITYDFDFTRYSVNSVTSKAPYRGLYAQKAIVFYTIENYSKTNMNGSEISITYTGYIFKDHWINNHTKNRTITSTYIYNSNTKKFI